MSEALRLMCRAMATNPIARHFVEEFSDELSTIPTATPLVAAIKASAAKGKVVTAEERNTGHVLYRLIRDAFDATLKSAAPVRPTPLPPYAPVLAAGAKVTKCPTTDENGRVPKEKRIKATAGSPAKATPGRASIALPLVKVDTIPEAKRAAARMLFFADARRVEHTQAALHDECKQESPDDARYWDAVFRDSKRPGLDPRDVMRKHRDIIGSHPEGLRILTAYEHHEIGAYAALDFARRIMLCVHRGEKLPDTLVRYWNAYPPPGTCTPEHREARKIATIKANAAIFNGRGWLAIPDAPAPIRFPIKGWDQIGEDA